MNRLFDYFSSHPKLVLFVFLLIIIEIIVFCLVRFNLVDHISPQYVKQANFVNKVAPFFIGAVILYSLIMFLSNK